MLKKFLLLFPICFCSAAEADPVLHVVFSEETKEQHGGLTLTPQGDVTVNPAGEAILKGKGYFVLTGNYSSWGPSLTICYESLQYVVDHNFNIFMIEAHDLYHEGFRQLSVHMPSKATDYKVNCFFSNHVNYRCVF